MFNWIKSFFGFGAETAAAQSPTTQTVPANSASTTAYEEFVDFTDRILPPSASEAPSTLDDSERDDDDLEEDFLPIGYTAKVVQLSYRSKKKRKAPSKKKKASSIKKKSVPKKQTRKTKKKGN